MAGDEVVIVAVISPAEGKADDVDELLHDHDDQPLTTSRSSGFLDR